MNENLKKLILFGGGAYLLYWLFLKPKTALAAPTVDVINQTQMQFASSDNKVEIDLNGAYNTNGKQGIDFQVMTYIPADESREYLFGDTIYKGDASYQTVKTDKAGVQTAINVTTMDDKMTVAVTQNTSPINIFQQSFDWDGNPVA